MRGHGKMRFVPFFQPPQIIQLKEPPRRIEVIHSDRDAYDPDAESQELCLELRIGRPYLGECALVKQDIDPAHFLLVVIVAKGRILPKQFGQIQYPFPQLREYRRSLLIAALYHHREQEGWCAAGLYQLRQFFFGNVQNISSNNRPDMGHCDTTSSVLRFIILEILKTMKWRASASLAGRRPAKQNAHSVPFWNQMSEKAA